MQNTGLLTADRWCNSLAAQPCMDAPAMASTLLQIVLTSLLHPEVLVLLLGTCVKTLPAFEELCSHDF